MFSRFLDEADVRRVETTIRKLREQGVHAALTGGLAIELRLDAHGMLAWRRPLNDLDFVVAAWESIPTAVNDAFVQEFVRPDAIEGKLLRQLIDPETGLRIDFFRAFGSTLSRTEPFETDVGPIEVVSLEDLVARSTALVHSHVRSGKPLEAKYARDFERLAAFGDPAHLETAWRDHRQEGPASFGEARLRASRFGEAGEQARRADDELTGRRADDE